MTEWLNKNAVNNFCEYLKIETTHPNPDYDKSVQYLKEQAEQLELTFKVIELAPKHPIVIMKWVGKHNDNKSIVLNSHMDVVPVSSEQWKYPPFSAHIDENGDIYARGSQDMKCVTIQYLEAIRRIKTFSPEYIPDRHIYLLFVPDEEIGGINGMGKFVETEIFKSMNIGIMMDEGIASTNEEYNAFYGQRIIWWITVVITGDTGHAARFIKNSAGCKLRILLDKFMDYRLYEETRMIENDLSLGDVTTINLTGLEGGLQHNIVPDHFSLNFDMRIAPNTDFLSFQNMLDKWAIEAGGGIQYQYILKSPNISAMTNIDSSNPWWTSFESVCKLLNMKVNCQIFPACTDSNYVRLKGISAIGFSPINNTPILLHDNDEYLNIKTFIRGIDFYEKLIIDLAAIIEQ